MTPLSAGKQTMHTNRPILGNESRSLRLGWMLAVVVSTLAILWNGSSFAVEQAHAAIAHDAATESHTGTTGNTSSASFTFSHNPVGTPRGILVFVYTISATKKVTGVTYDGEAMTEVSGGAAVDTATEPGRVDTFFLGTGVNTTDPANVVVSRTNDATVMYAVAVSVTASYDTEVTGVVLQQQNGTLSEANVDDGSPGSNSLRYAGSYYGGASPAPAGSNSTSLNSIDFGAFGVSTVRETTAGQGSRPVGVSAATDDRATVHLAIREILPSTISGSCKTSDRSTNCSDGQTVKYAVNGVLQGTSTTTSGGTWSITPGSMPANGDIVTVFLDGVADSNEALAVTKYDGSGSMSGILLYARHLTIGSGDNQSISNSDLAQYDNSVSSDEDVFLDVTSGNLMMDATTSNSGQTLYVVSGNTYAPGGTATIGGSWVNAGTFTHGSSTVTLNGTTTGYIVDANGSSGPFYNLTFNGSGGGWTATTTDMTVANVLTITTGNFSGGSRTITLSGTSTPFVNNATFTYSTSTVKYTGNGATGILAMSGSGGTNGYYNLHLMPSSSSAQVLASGTYQVNNSLTVGNGTNAGATGATNNPTLNVGGVFTIAANATYTTGSGTITLSGSGTPFVPTGTFTASTGNTVVFTGTSTTAVAGNASEGVNSYYNLSLLPAATVEYDVGSAASHNLNISNALVIGNGTNALTFDIGTYNPGSINAVGGTITIAANSTLSGNGATIVEGKNLIVNGTVNMTGTGRFRPDGSGSTMQINSTGNTVVNLRIGDTQGTESSTASGGGEITVTGAFTVSDNHTFNAGNLTYILAASGTGASSRPFRTDAGGQNTGTFNADTSTVRYTGSSTTEITDSTYNNLELKAAGNATHQLPTGTVTVNGNLVVGNATNTTTVDWETNDTTLTVKGGISLVSPSVWTKSSSATLTWSPVGTVTWSDGNATKQDLGTVSISGGTSTPKVNLGSSVSATTISTVAASHELSLNGGNTLTLTGTTGTPLSVSGTFTASTGTVAYTGNNGAGNTTIASVSYYDLLVNNASETFAMPATGTVTGDLTISAGTFLSSSGTLTIGDDFTNNGTFTHNSGTVAFANAVVHDIGGNSSTAFNNFSNTVAGSTLRFKHHTANVPLYDVAGTFTVTGSNGNNITITSDDGANQWLVDFASAQSSVTYATISYSGCLTSANVTLDATSTDGSPGGTNGTCWVFPVSGISVSGTATTTGTVAVAVNGTIQAQTTTISGGTWTISGVTAPSTNDVITVFVDGAADGAEATGVTKYDGTGNITGMVLNTNTLTIGSADNPSITVTNLDQYDCVNDEDVMHRVNASVFEVQGSTTCQGSVSNSYSDETVSILSGATLTIGSSESLTTDNFTNAGTVTSTTTATYSVSGNWTNSSTFTPATSTVTFTATDTGHTINNGASTFNNVTFNGSGGGWSPLTNAMTIGGDLAMTAGTLSGTLDITVNGGDVTGGGTISMTGGTFTINGNTSSGFGSGAGTPWTFYNLTFGDGSTVAETTTNGSNTVTVSSVLTIRTNHTLTNEALNFTLSGSGTPLVKTGGLSNDPSTTFTYTSGSGVTALSSAAVTGTSAFGHLTINGTGTFTAGVALEAKSDLTVSGGTLAMAANNLTVGNSSNSNSGSIKVASGQSLTQSSGGTTTILSSASGTNCIGSTGASCSGTQGTITFGGLTIGDGATTFTTTLGATSPTVTVAGTLNITTSSTFAAGSSALTLSASGTPITRSGTFTAGTSNVTFTSGSGVTALSSAAMTGSNAFYNLTINGTGTFTAGVNLDVGNDLTITSGTLAGTPNITVSGGDATGAGTINLTGGTFLIDGTGNFGGASGWTFSSLTFGDGTGSTTTTSTGAGAVTVTGTLTIAANQTLDAASKTWTLSGTGTPFVKTGTFTANSSTFNFTGAGATTITAASYANLGIKPGANATTHTMGAGSFTISGNLTLGNGTNTTAVVDADTYDPGITTTGGSSVVAIANNTEFKAGGGQLVLSGSGTPLTVGATAGVFTANNSDVKYEGTSATTIAGVTYYFLFVGTTADSNTVTYTLGGNTSATGVTVGASSGSGVHTLDASNKTLTITGTGTSFSIASQGAFTASTSTVVYAPAPSSTVTLAPVTYHHLTLNSASTTFNLPSAGVTTDNGGDLTITAGTLDAVSGGNYALSIGGSFISSGTFTPRNGTVTFTSTSTGKTIAPTSFYNVTFNGSGGGWSFDSTTAITGDISMTAGTLSGTSSMTVDGNFTGNGTVNLTGGTVTMSSTTSKNFGGATAWTFYNLTGSGVSGTTVATGAGGITVSNVLTNGANHTLDAGSKTWTLSLTGTPFVQNGTFTPSTSTVQYTGGHNTTFTPDSYYNLTVAPACDGCIHVANNGTLSVGNNFVIGNGTNTSAAFTMNGNNIPITVSGNFTISTNTSFTAPTTGNISVGGNWSNSGTFNANGKSVTFTATSGTKTINNGASSFYDLILNGSGGTFQPSGNTITVSNDLTVTAGTLSGTLGVTVNGGDVTGAGTINMTGGTFLIDGTGNFGSGTNWTFYNLTLGDGTGTATSTATGAGSLTVSNVLTIAANQTLDLGSKDTTLSSTGTPITRTGTFTAGTSTVTYTGAGVAGVSSAAMTGSNAFYNLTINGSGTITAGVALEAKNDLTITGGTLAMAANNLTVGNSSNSNSGSIKVASGQSLTQSSGGTTTVLTSASGSNCIGSTGASCSGTQGTITFGGLTIGDGSTAQTTTLGATTPTIGISGVLNITANSIFDAGTGSSINLSGTGTPITRGGTFTKGTSTVSFTSGSGTAGLTSAAMTGSSAFYNLTINGTGTFTAGSSALEVSNDLAITSGTLDLNTNDPALDINDDVNVSGTLLASSSGAFTIAGDFTNAGTFTHNSGTVTFDTTGTSVITGATTFSNFTSTTAGKTIKFQKHTANSPVFTFAGTFTITGINGNPIYIQSDTAASQWLAHFNGAQSAVTYATIQDSGCDAGSAEVAASITNVNDGNNGVCWLFIAGSVNTGGGFRIEGGGGGGGNAQSGGSGQGGGGGAAEGGSGGGGAAQGGGSGQGGGGGGGGAFD